MLLNKGVLSHFQENILYFLRETYYSAVKQMYMSFFNKYGTLSEHGEKRHFIKFLNYKYERNGKDQRTVKNLTLERITFLWATSGKKEEIALRNL